ncbi:MAG: hypothetical protein WDO13_21930 [Verrucomicrobiota bacterium]
MLDTLDGAGMHTFDALFQMDSPGADIDPATQAVFSKNVSGAQLGLYPLEPDNLKVNVVQGQPKPLLGWMPVEHRAIPTIRFRKQQAAPAIFATFLYPFQDARPDFAASALTISGDGWWGRSFKTARESVDIALKQDVGASPVVITSPVGGDIQAEASGLVIRQANGKDAIGVGAWNLSRYSDAQAEFFVQCAGHARAGAPGHRPALLQRRRRRGQARFQAAPLRAASPWRRRRGPPSQPRGIRPRRRRTFSRRWRRRRPAFPIPTISRPSPRRIPPRRPRRST